MQDNSPAHRRSPSATLPRLPGETGEPRLAPDFEPGADHERAPRPSDTSHSGRSLLWFLLFLGIVGAAMYLFALSAESPPLRTDTAPAATPDQPDSRAAPAPRQFPSFRQKPAEVAGRIYHATARVMTRSAQWGWGKATEIGDFTYAAWSRATLKQRGGWLGAFALLGLLVWIYRRRAARRSLYTTHSVRRGRRAALRLIKEIELFARRMAETETADSARREQIHAAAQGVADMSMAVVRMSESATQSTRRVRQAAEATRRGLQAVRNTMDGVAQSRVRMGESAALVEQLGEALRKMEEMGAHMTEVAEQAHVLSLNTTIQEAQRGESRSGLGLIAEEVRQLADRATRAAREVSLLEQGVRRQAEITTASVQSTTAQITTAVDMAGKAGWALEKMERATQELLEGADQATTEATRESATARSAGARVARLTDAADRWEAHSPQLAAALAKLRTAALRLRTVLNG